VTLLRTASVTLLWTASVTLLRSTSVTLLQTALVTLLWTASVTLLRIVSKVSLTREISVSLMTQPGKKPLFKLKIESNLIASDYCVSKKERSQRWYLGNGPISRLSPKALEV